MGSFGDKLKKEREQRSISLDDISLSTKIGTRLLRALEEERFEQLPGGIFNKGFVRAYARHVGLDEEQTIADYLAALGESQVKTAPAPLVPAAKSEPSDGHALAVPPQEPKLDRAAEIPWGALALALLLIALAFASWSYYHRASQVEKSTNRPPPTAEAVTPGLAIDSAATSPPISPRSEVRVPQSNRAPSTPIPVTDQSSSQSAPVAQAALHAAAPLQDSTTPAGMFTVLLKGNDESEECWVSSAADGQPTEEVTLVGPYETAVHARNEAVIRIGSAGAVDIFFNGKKLPSQGDYGVVRTLRFRSDGLQAPSKPAESLPPMPR